MKILKTMVMHGTLAFATLVASSSFAEIVFDTLTKGYQGVTFNSVEFGNAISLGGTSRTVTQLRAWVGASGNSTFTFRLYNLDGPSSAPGSLIWESPVQNFVYTPPVPTFPDDDIYIVPVPNVVVPNSLAWTIKTQAGPFIGWVRTGSPTAGSYIETWQYLAASSQWAPYNGAHFGAQITAVPEPALLALVSVVSTIIMLQRSRRG